MSTTRWHWRISTWSRAVAGVVAFGCLASGPAAAQSAVRFDGPALRDALRAAGVEPAVRAAQSDWRSVQRLRPGTVIMVIVDGRTSISGRFVAADPTALTLLPAGETAPHTVARDEVAEVTGRVSRRGSKLGAVVGAGAGAFVGVLAALNLAYQDCGGNCTDEKWLMGVALVGIPVGGGVLGYHALAGPRRAELIYRRAP